MLRLGTSILQRELHGLLLFLPGLAIAAVLLRLGRFLQLRSAGKTWYPADSARDSTKAKDAANLYKGVAVTLTGALAVDAWWNYPVTLATVITFALLTEIWILMRWAGGHRDRPH